MKEIVSKMIKYKDRILLIILGIILIIGYIVSDNKLEPNKKPEISTGFANISVNQYLNLLKDNKLSIIYLGSNNCPHSKRATTILAAIVNEYDINVNFLNSDNFTQTDKVKFNGSVKEFNEGKWGTPTVMIVKNNKIVEMADGIGSDDVKAKERYVNLFKKYEIIK